MQAGDNFETKRESRGSPFPPAA